MRFDAGVLEADPGPRADVLAVIESALEAVDPAAAVRRHLPRLVAAPPPGRVIVLALGKAALPMAAAAVAVLAGVPITGVAATNTRGEVPGLEVVVAGHPVPDTGSLRAGRRLLEAANAAGPDDLVLTLISGGGSALAEVPADGLTLDDLEATGTALLRSGADIVAFNTVRKHLSAIKGGRLALAAGAGRMVTLVISDVVGNPLESIASGPTVPDPSTYADALTVVDDFRVVVPERVRDHLRRGVEGAREETPAGGEAFARQTIRVIADAAAAADGARRGAAARGIEAHEVTTALQGEAREVAVGVAEAMQHRAGPGEMLLYAGETTVTVTGPGRGGRNQALARAAGIALSTGGGAGLVASFGTDGIDGPTDAAGGIGDPGTVARGAARGMDAAAALDDNDAGSYLEVCGDLLRCGPTGTNVGDLVLAYRPAG